MNSSILRQVWTVVEESQAHGLLSLPDQDLVNQLLERLQEKEFLSTEDSKKIRGYLSSRTPLIRDLAQARLKEIQVHLGIDQQPQVIN
ncbi:hypothetical protein PCC7424_1004 [Gloeothece citriformis PCC 7424]|uniref:Uncharacterized protein n=1 Tax=Gloeothece citriformis (strain PCC 7424) TaxID=65393 RepID=B7KIQ2_GLOC7|nr:hypothetical protein [Gloeothece citriformis]ACK69458.1 hypothetical protein PCC7424_1004 [Gloeothece citriformis PCC 7424]